MQKKLLPDIRQLSEFYVFQQDCAPAHRSGETVDLLTSRKGNSRLHSSDVLAAKHPGIKSDGLKSVVNNAGEGLQRADQGRRQTAFVYSASLGRTAWIRALLIRQSGSGARVFVRVLTQKADTLNTN